jgi:archaellum component FlaG (FlaF/FlaG flagellin family)
LAYSKSKIQVVIDGVAATEIELPRCANEQWQIATANVALPKGKHTVRIVNNSGNTNLHWMIFD